jgi:hypothetical protein
LARQASTAAAIAARSPSKTAEGVEQLALPALVEEALLVVLAVDLDEPSGHVRQPRRRHRFVVHSGSRSAGGGNLADADERLRQAIEQGLDPACLGPVPDQRRVGPGTDCQAQGIDQEALAGAGLAGEDVEAGLERDPQPSRSGPGLERSAPPAARRPEALRASVPSGPPPRPRPPGRPDPIPNRAGLELFRHDGSNSDFCRSRSQNGTAPRGSMRRIGRSISQTETTSPIASRRSSRPSTLIRTSYASRIRHRTVWRGLTTTVRIAVR